MNFYEEKTDSAKVFLEKHFFDLVDQVEYLKNIRSAKDLKENIDFTIKDIEKAMVSFAKNHVEMALKEACRNATANVKNHRYGMREWTTNDVNSWSIINAYPLENIK